MKGRQLVSALALYACSAAGVAAKTTGSPIELDLVFPNPNITYTVDSQAVYFPLIFAFQGFRPAIFQDNLDFYFGFSLQNLNATGPNAMTLESGNYFNTTFGDDISNSDGSPAFYVNTILLNGNLSDATIVEGIVNYFSMDIYLNWGDASLASCDNNNPYAALCNSPCQLMGSTTFAVWGGTPKNAPASVSVAGPMDEMPDVTKVCPEPIFYQGWNATATTMCDTYTQIPESSATPCAVKPNPADVSSLSSIASANVAIFSSAYESAGSSGSAAAATQTGSARPGSAQHTTGTPKTAGTAASATTGPIAPKTSLSSSSSTTTPRSPAMVTAMPYPAAPLLLGAGVLGGMHFYL